MKEKIKRLFASIAAILMAIGLVGASAVPVFAETVNNTTDHSYTAYQIFSGTQATDSKQLGDVQWGSGINSSTFLTALKTDDNFKVSDTNIFADAESAQDVAEALATNTNGIDDSSFAKEFANIAVKYVQGTGTSIDANSTSGTLDSGYYLIVDNTSNPSDGAYNSALLKVTGGGDISITKKYTVPEFDKNIVRNDEAASTGKAVDRNIGDAVNYELSGTVPTNLADYDTYKYIFHDTLSKGQKIDVNSIKVFLVTEGAENSDITSRFTINKIASGEGTSSALTSENAGDGSEPLSFTIGIDNLKSIEGVSSTTRIIVRYTATLTNDSAIGSSGNKNEGYLEYSNNPNGTGEGTTVPKNTYVYTYQLDVTKKDGEGNDAAVLPNAQFVLKATNGIHNGKYVQIDASTGKLNNWLDTKPSEVDTKPTSGNTGVLVSGTDGKVSVIGLDAGSYELEEIKAPAGYNKLTSTIPVTITATIDENNANAATMTNASALTTLHINQDQTNYATDGKLPLTVVNNAGSVLPSTGGIGTTIFYAVGGAIIICAAVLLISRRKKSA